MLTPSEMDAKFAALLAKHTAAHDADRAMTETMCENAEPKKAKPAKEDQAEPDETKAFRDALSVGPEVTNSPAHPSSGVSRPTPAGRDNEWKPNQRMSLKNFRRPPLTEGHALPSVTVRFGSVLDRLARGVRGQGGGKACCGVCDPAVVPPAGGQRTKHRRRGVGSCLTRTDRGWISDRYESDRSHQRASTQTTTTTAATANSPYIMKVSARPLTERL